MRLPASSERTPGADTRAASALAWLALAVLGACSSGPKRPVMHPAKPITREEPAPAAAPAPAPATRAAAAAPAAATANPTAPGVAAGSAHPQVSPAGRAGIARGVRDMRV